MQLKCHWPGRRLQYGGACDAAEHLSAVTWMDRRPVFFLSTCHDPSETTAVRWREKSGQATEVFCPTVAAAYNRSMGGCERNDQMAKLHCSCRYYHWPRRLVMKCLLWSAYNGCIVIESCLSSPQQPGKRRRTFLHFCDDLILQLLGDNISPVAHRSQSSTDGPTHLQNVGCHFPERPSEATRNNTCVVCREKFSRYAKEHPSVVHADNPHSMMKTVFRCTDCQQYLESESHGWMLYFGPVNLTHAVSSRLACWWQLGHHIRYSMDKMS